MSTLPSRKTLRLSHYNYSQNGSYFLTLCTIQRQNLLGEIMMEDSPLHDQLVRNNALTSPTNTSPNIVGDGALDVPHLSLSTQGHIVNSQLLLTSTIYKRLSIDKYVIMPNHIHLILSIITPENGMSRAPSPTHLSNSTKTNSAPQNQLIPAFISQLKRFVHKECGASIFQRGYHDHIIRNENDYNRIWQYIHTNPTKWINDKYYQETQKE